MLSTPKYRYLTALFGYLGLLIQYVLFFMGSGVLSINGALKEIKSQIDGGFQRQWEIGARKQEKHEIFCVFENMLCPK